MTNNDLFLSFLHNKFDKISFELYYFQQIDQPAQFVYAHGDIEINKSKFVIPTSSKDEKMIIQTDGESTRISFFYPENEKVLFYLACPTIDQFKDELDSFYLIFSYLNIKNKMKAKDAELASMLESTRSITSSLELQEVLNSIITHALSVIPAADVGYLQLYDEKTERLIPRASVGFNDQLRATKLKSGESITGKVFKDGLPVIYYSRSEIYQGMATLSEDNFHYIQESFDNAKIKALISVPLILENKAFGVMTVQQLESQGQLNNNDLNLLQIFTAQAAIAIKNANLYKNAQDRLDEITILTKQLTEKNELLLKRAEIHETLTQLSLQNKSVEFIIFEINRIMNRDVFFFDYLETELYQKMNVANQQAMIDAFSQNFSNKKTPIYIDSFYQNETKTYIYPILSDRVSLGCFAIPLYTPLSALDIVTIEQASSVLALEMTKRKTQAEVYYKKTQELFHDLLHTKNPAKLEEIGESLGINKNSIYTVLLLKVDSYRDLFTLENEIHRLIIKIKRHIPEKRKIIFGFHNKITILLPTNTYDAIDDLIVKLQAQLFKWGEQAETLIYAGLSTSHHGIDSISKSYDEAKKSLSYAISRRKTDIMHYQKMGINRLFITQSSSEIENYTNEILSPLRTVKSRKNELEKTLFAYIKSNKSTIDSAEKLHIHKNTLYQRLKKIEDLLQLDLENPDDFLQIQLACHLYESFPQQENTQ
ncbi:helix-turn-helix domain-containing protein [Metabacillus rhizolycopersici]|uniref:Helix-turn-helix domain-containing protein n=1 Tax=Metabacillus rhizolycopersici TaxID=2875709 RepID=A0ABS7UME9_9BACI|nr:helix-turn-helix domain-containing protein [Metabacillus rhizolycopersici]MBZ5749488.1 helix-turn-helix domain-containing protein [Metabacillus rhizolycopersici]